VKQKAGAGGENLTVLHTKREAVEKIWPHCKLNSSRRKAMGWQHSFTYICAI